MTSIFENTSSKVMVHILHDNTLTDENRQRFIRTTEKYHQGINFVDMSEYAEKFTEHKISKYWTIGTMYRLFIIDMLPELDKIIYLDCDILVNLDISELWNIDIEDKSFAAVLDTIPETLKAYSTRNLQLRLININRKFYINAGVLVMNLQKIRSQYNTSQPIFDWFAHYAHLLPFLDQDLINSMFAGDIKILDSKYNVYKLKQDLSGCIIHMWAGKPWLKFSGAEHERLYWKFYLLSAWGDDMTPEGMMLKLSETASRSQTVQKPTPKQPVLIRFAKSLWHMIPNTIRKYILETHNMTKVLRQYISHGMIHP